MNATGPNGPIGMDANHSDGSEGVSFSWDDGVVDEGKQLNEVDGNEADGNEVDGNETDGNEEARDEQHENGAYENEAHLVGVCSGEETKYLDSADVGTLYAYVVGNRFDFTFVSNNKEKVRVVCKGKGCPFVVHASQDKFDGCFKVKTLVTDHNCSVTFKNSRANFKFVGKHFISELRILPTLRSVQMIKLGREELNVELNKKLCFRARKWALEKIMGSVVHEFHRLWDYVNTLRAVDVRDGSFLKGSFKGEILSAVGRDCNNQNFPIAWAVVEVENRETLAWFLNNLQHDIGFGDGDGCTLLSDMQKGLLEEVPLYFPKIEHRFCARHMYANWRKVHNGGDLRMLFWKCYKATTQSEFAKYAKRIGKLKGKAYDDFMEKDPIHWSKVFFSTSSKCDAVDNNFSEAFNSAIIGARFKSIISMLEDIRHYVMNRIVEQKESHLGGKVVHGDDTFVVDVREWTCTCRVWDLIGIPCPHAVCVILYREEPLNQYVIGLYKKEKYQELYSVVLPTVASEQFWKYSGMGKIDPPLHRKMQGRPKHKRRREEGEVENHGPSLTPSAPPSSQTSHVPPSSQIPSPPSSQTSHVPPSSQIPSAPQSTPQSTPTMVFMPTPSIQKLSELGRPSQVLLSRPHTRSFTKPTSQPTSTTATSPVAAPVSASSGPDATAIVSPEAKLLKLTIKRHPSKN
ncbi:hypothetical protein GQ457_13G011060 [Hibiscus cannabinus]